MTSGKIYNNIVETVGHTPLVRLNHVTAGLPATVALKCEFFNPLGSVKDRIGMAMIEAAERDGKLIKGQRRSSSRPAATPASRWRSSAPRRATNASSPCPRR